MASVQAHNCNEATGHQSRRLDCLVRLVKLGADPALRDGYGCTPLHYSVWCGMANEMLFLLHVAPELLTMADERGNTPLHYAAFTVSLRMEDGKRPLDLARAVGFVEGAAELGSHTGVPTLKRLAMQRATSLNSLSLTRNLESQWDRSESDVANSTQSALSNSVMAGSVDTQSDWLQLLVGTEDLGDVFGFGVECCQCCISRETNLYRYA
ncbi:hypothetical protein SARC_09002 [Sphaeroforma arctica JP610]|uniref:Uncharacterized protein n=1 Tax=Sphaeroforma arctica JP610 TaxID=667725 RepID=A0A0L0FPE7_9EUKA|nr:hypothetical protein SARC_09002 [Sphaeroforma arctica JP610]KNC78574.1 hypothetical protein SARC_09002 [Sphaeroforma arctica JP610]|eukprot:XP_014152476.1 hypothetical protein SARC_09002 [Sphaeroforma arctica JP610]